MSFSSFPYFNKAILKFKPIYFYSTIAVAIPVK